MEGGAELLLFNVRDKWKERAATEGRMVDELMQRDAARRAGSLVNADIVVG